MFHEIDDFKNIGIDVLNPTQSNAKETDPVRIKKKTAGKTGPNPTDRTKAWYKSRFLISSIDISFRAPYNNAELVKSQKKERANETEPDAGV